MADDLPFYHPDNRPKPREPQPGERVWTLTREATTLTCELRDAQRTGAGCEVQVFEDGALLLAQRCASRDSARSVAGCIRRDYVCEGWAEEPIRQAGIGDG